MKHGSVSSYSRLGCRCDECKSAWRAYYRAYYRKRNGGQIRERASADDRDALRDLLMELFPDGLTDDCPARRNRAAA